jgi:lipoprotein LprG
MRPTRATARALAAAALGVLLLPGLAACSGDDSVSDGRTPEQVMDLAKKNLDETSGVSITLDSDGLPDGVAGLSSGEGVGTHAPAFEGTIGVIVAGAPVDVPVVAVDDTVYAKLPFTFGWQDIDPADYGAPDPATLMSTDSGFSSLLPATTDLEEGDSVRGGADNKEVLTEYTGTVPGDVVSNVIPSAEGDFDATYSISSDGELRTAELTGVFYPDTEAMTYTIGFDDYGTEKDIVAP